MSIDYAKLENQPRLLLQAELEPLQGDRFQPTGFPDLGPARYTAPRKKKDGSYESVEMLLVESTQSVANRMELVCLDEAKGELIPDLNGLAYVRVDCGEIGKTNTIKEFHRLNSPYIWTGKDTQSVVAFRQSFLTDLGVKAARKKKPNRADDDTGEEGSEVPGLLDLHKLYRAAFKWDTNSVLHGLFLEKVAGRLRMARALSGFIEASNVNPADSGGAKVDDLLPSPKQLGLSADDGYGNVPFPRTEFVAQEITAYFNLDLALLRGYGLNAEATNLLVALSLFKIRRFLSRGLRLRTACDLGVVGDLTVKRPNNGFSAPPETELLSECNRLIGVCRDANLFADPSVTIVEWKRPNAGKIEVDLPTNTGEPEIPKELKSLIKWGKPTRKKGPRLVFPEGLNPETVEQAKRLFAGNEEATIAIDQALNKQIPDATETNGDGANDE